MSKYLRVIFFVVTFFVASLANPPKSEVNYCKIDGYPQIRLRANEKLTLPGTCTEVICIDPLANHSGMIGCPLIRIPNGCTFTDMDYSKPYPDCCYQVKC